MATVAVDLDGTIAEWGHDGTQVGAWRDGAQDFVRGLFALDGGQWPLRVLVCSCRATWLDGGGWQSIAEFLRKGGFVPWLVVSCDPEPQRERWLPLRKVLDDGELVWAVPQLADGSFDLAAAGSGPEPDGPNVGIWRGLGKPIASAYVDDRAVPVVDELTWADVFAHVRSLV